MNQQQNPLSGFFRQKKISVKIPSDGKFYPDGFFEFNNGDELDVLAMTAQDELNLKNPDALLNGQGMVDIIKSCVPGVKGKPEQLLLPDMSVLMLAIRFATYGDEIEFPTTCPECGEENHFQRSIRHSLDLMEFLDDSYEIKLESGLAVELHPHTFKTSTKANIAHFEQAKIMQIVERDSLAEEEKVRKFGESFKRMAAMNFDLVADSIKRIKTPDNQEVTKREFINEFLKELEPKEAERIQEKIKEMNETGVSTSHACKCHKCEHEWTEYGIQYDPAHFFE